MSGFGWNPRTNGVRLNNRSFCRHPRDGGCFYVRGGIGAPAIITTAVINQSGRSFELDTSPCGDPRFIARTASGAEIPMVTSACFLMKTGVILAPGAQYSFATSWDGSNGQDRLVAGEYEVIGAPWGANGPRSAPAHVTVH